MANKGDGEGTNDTRKMGNNTGVKYIACPTA